MDRRTVREHSESRKKQRDINHGGQRQAVTDSSFALQRWPSSRPALGAAAYSCSREPAAAASTPPKTTLAPAPPAGEPRMPYSHAQTRRAPRCLAAVLLPPAAITATAASSALAHRLHRAPPRPRTPPPRTRAHCACAPRCHRRRAPRPPSSTLPSAVSGPGTGRSAGPARSTASLAPALEHTACAKTDCHPSAAISISHGLRPPCLLARRAAAIDCPPLARAPALCNGGQHRACTLTLATAPTTRIAYTT